MKKLIHFLLVVLVSFLTMSCGKFADGTSVWQGGLWIIPIATFIASVWSFYRGYTQWKSGSGGYQGNPPRWVESKEKVPFFSVGATWFGIIFLCACIGSIIWVNLDK